MREAIASTTDEKDAVARQRSGRVFLIGTGPGDPGLLTLKVGPACFLLHRPPIHNCNILLYPLRLTEYPYSLAASSPLA